ncbi:MAG: hypothetical protein L0229_22985, partial [Blastocatellia bacterium]|nr:hypothetical protein [Blastocatellia bacterium]
AVKPILIKEAHYAFETRFQVYQTRHQGTVARATRRGYLAINPALKNRAKINRRYAALFCAVFK